jgi:glucose/arabinose dehydrogenase
MIILLIFVFFLNFVEANEIISDFRTYPHTSTKFQLKKITENVLNFPWGLSFIDDHNLLVTEKNGRLLKINIKTGQISEINHKIQSLKYKGKRGFQQGGLLDVLVHSDGYIYFTYSHLFRDLDEKSNNSSSSAIARGILKQNKIINLEELLIAKPKLEMNIHWGSRMVIRNSELFASFGERGQGMIAQDPSKHPGSIIRINTDGSIPRDNPFFLNYESWLPEIYQIGLRNPQGITISPNDGEIYFSQHGPKGGDNIGKVKFAGNSGWKNIAWGGTEYSGRKIGSSPFENFFDSSIISWVPSIGVGNISFYRGEEFKEWEGDLIVSATKTQMLARLNFENNKIVGKEVILKKEIGRIRDFEISKNGYIYIIVDEEKSALWLLSKKKSID